MRAPPDDRSPAELLAFGVVNLDKPPGPSAHEMAGWLRDAAATAVTDADTSASSSPVPTIDRAAHTGTLDPKVTGSLPVLFGDATRLAQIFADSLKEYVAVLELHGPAPADFGAVVESFEGELYQKPPRKSAVRRRLRTRTVHTLDVLERDGRQALLRVRCGAGTYVRKLCHDIGLALGTGAHMGDLRRTAAGTFDETSLVTAETIVDALAFWASDDDPRRLREIVQPAERALIELARVVVAPSAAEQIAHGAPVYAPGVIRTEPAPAGGAESSLSPSSEELVACCTPDGAAVCLGRLVGDPTADTGTIVDLERVLI
ncbi:MAG: rRNA pseudouridine synthase, putative [halophilic archaeon J07HX5]|jgi:tRNA pseudouridine synthase B (EC 4.2.1.70)|nr:MAG: rRNA pseudouridine synthase, putative [halophilic archaeon J07HX5]